MDVVATVMSSFISLKDTLNREIGKVTTSVEAGAKALNVKLEAILSSLEEGFKAFQKKIGEERESILSRFQENIEINDRVYRELKSKGKEPRTGTGGPPTGRGIIEDVAGVEKESVEAMASSLLTGVEKLKNYLPSRDRETVNTILKEIDKRIIASGKERERFYELLTSEFREVLKEIASRTPSFTPEQMETVLRTLEDIATGKQKVRSSEIIDIVADALSRTSITEDIGTVREVISRMERENRKTFIEITQRRGRLREGEVDRDTIRYLVTKVVEATVEASRKGTETEVEEIKEEMKEERKETLKGIGKVFGPLITFGRMFSDLTLLKEFLRDTLEGIVPAGGGGLFQFLPYPRVFETLFNVFKSLFKGLGPILAFLGSSVLKAFVKGIPLLTRGIGGLVRGFPFLLKGLPLISTAITALWDFASGLKKGGIITGFARLLTGRKGLLGFLSNIVKYGGIGGMIAGPLGAVIGGGIGAIMNIIGEERLEKFFKGVGSKLKDVFSGIKNVFGWLWEKFTSFGGSLKETFSTVGSILGSVIKNPLKTVTESFKWFAERMKGFSEFFKEAFSRGPFAWIGKIFGRVRGIFKRKGPVTGKEEEKIRVSLSETVHGLLENIAGTVKSTFSKLWETVKGRMGIGGMIMGLPEATREFVGSIFSSISSKISSVFQEFSVEGMGESIGKLLASIKEKFLSVKDTLESVFSSLKEGISGFLSSFDVSDVLTSMKDTFAGIKERIVGIAETVVSKIKEMTFGLREKIRTFFEEGELFSMLKEKFEGMKEGIKGVVSGIFGKIGSFFSWIKQMFSRQAGRGEVQPVMGGGPNIAEVVESFISSGMGKMIEVVGKIKQGISSLLSGIFRTKEKAEEMKAKAEEAGRAVASLSEEAERLTLTNVFAGFLGAIQKIAGSFPLRDIKNTLGGISSTLDAFFKTVASTLGKIDLAKTVERSVEGIKNFFAGPISNFVSTVSNFFRKVWNFFAGEPAMATEKGPAQTVEKWTTVVTETFKNVFSGVTKIFDFISSVKEKVLTSFEGIKEFLSGEFISTVTEGVKSFFGVLERKIVSIPQFLSSIPAKIEEAVGKVSQFVLPEDFVSKVISFAQTAVETVKGFFTSGKFIETFVSGLKSLFTGDFIRNIVEGVKTVFSSLNVENIVNAVSSGIQSAVSKVQESLSSLDISSVVENVKTSFSSLFEGMKRTVSSVSEFVATKLESVGKFAEGIASSFGTFWETTKQNIFGFLTSISSKMSTAISSVFERFKSVFLWFSGESERKKKEVEEIDIQTQATQQIDQASSKMVETVSGVFSTISSKVQEAVNVLWTKVAETSSALGSFWEGIRETFFGSIRGVFSFVSEIALDVEGKVEEIVSSISDRIGKVVEGISGFWEGIKGTVYASIGGVVENVRGIMGAVKSKIVELFSFFTKKREIETTGEEEKTAILNEIQKVFSFVSDTVLGIKEKVNEVISSTVSRMEETFQGLTQFWGTAKETFFGSIGNVLGKVGGMLSSIFDFFKGKVGETQVSIPSSEEIEQLSSKVTSSITSVLSSVFSNVPSIVNTAVNKINTFVTRFNPQDILQAITNATTSLKGIVETVVGNVLNFPQSLGSRIGEVLRVPADFLQNALSSISSKFSSFFTTITSVVGGIVPGIETEVSSSSAVITDRFEALTSTLNESTKAFMKKFSEMKEKFVGVTVKIFENVANAVKEIVEHIKDLVKNLVKTFWNWLKGRFFGKKAKTDAVVIPSYRETVVREYAGTEAGRETIGGVTREERTRVERNVTERRGEKKTQNNVVNVNVNVLSDPDIDYAFGLDF